MRDNASGPVFDRFVFTALDQQERRKRFWTSTTARSGLAGFVGVILSIVALRLLYGVVVTLLHGSEGTFALALIGGLGIAIAIKVIAYWYTTRINRRVDSPGLRALRADALTDIYASAAAMAA